MEKACLAIVAMYVLCTVSSTGQQCGANTGCAYAYAPERYPIVISIDSYPMVRIMIYAPDFNSSPYAIDTIGKDGSTVAISTRGASIPYRLVETGPDTGYFAGYVILSSDASTCSPVCGPTDGFLAAGGDDAVTVSFTYADGHTAYATSHPKVPANRTIPEFQFATLGFLAAMIFLPPFGRSIFT